MINEKKKKKKAKTNIQSYVRNRRRWSGGHGGAEVAIGVLRSKELLEFVETAKAFSRNCAPGGSEARNGREGETHDDGVGSVEVAHFEAKLLKGSG